MSPNLGGLPARVRFARTILTAPRVRVEISGDAHARRIHRAFTRRHARLRVTSAKRWGVAMVDLSTSFDDYLAGLPKEVGRKRRLAERRGFVYAVVPSREHLDDILEINRSSPVRQGRAMPGYYLDRDAIVETYRDRESIHAVLDGQGRMRAYAWVPDVGDAVVFETLLGHADDLDSGTMYLLISEVIRGAIDRRERTGAPDWAMYDTFWGASPGLAYFKERLGFRPYTVDWVWVEPSVARPPSRGSAATSPADERQSLG